MRRAIVLLAGVVAAVAVAVPASPALAGSGSAPPRVVTESGGTTSTAGLQARPRRIIYSGDGAALLAGRSSLRGSLHWTRWSGSGGDAVGADWRNDCTPDCAGGHYRGYGATVVVSRPRTVGGERVFTRLQIRYARAVPRYPGHRMVTLTLREHDHTLFWVG